MGYMSIVGAAALQSLLSQTDKKGDELIQQEGQVVQSTPDSNSSFYADCQIWPPSCAIGMMERGRDGESDTLTGVHVGVYNNYSSHKLRGFEAALFNDNRSSVQGMQLGVYNKAKNIEGSQLALISNDNDACEDISAYSVALLYNVTECDSSIGSAQLSILYNEAKNITIQASLVSYADEVKGVQVGLLSYAKEFTGLQVAVMSFVESFKGMSVGVISAGYGSMHGLRIALFNIQGRYYEEETCHGVQIGIANSESPYIGLGFCNRD